MAEQPSTQVITDLLNNPNFKALSTLVNDAKIQVVYYCDPSAANPIFHHLPVPLSGDWDDELPFGFHKEAPDASLVDAIWSLTDRKWIENAAKSQPQQIAKLQGDSKSLKESLASLQKTTATVSQAVTASDQKVNSLSQIVTAATSANGQTAAALSKLTAAVNQLVDQSKNKGAK